MQIFRYKKVWLVSLYFFVRFLAFYAEPSSPLHAANPVNNAIGIGMATVILFLLLKKNDIAWYFIAGEIILGGSGNYFEIFGVSLRTILLILSLSTFFVQQRNFVISELKKIYIIPLMVCVAIFGILNGFLKNNSPGLILADAIPYLFLLYYFPLKRLLQNPQWKSFCLDAIKSAIIGQSLFILFTFITFSTNWFILQGAFYHWYRDIANGKITWVELNFYRLVLNEQMLLAPLLIYFLYEAIYKKARYSFLYISLILLLLSLNLTRIYMLSIALGSLLLFSKPFWKRWLIVISGSAAVFFIIFCSLNLFSSGGQTLGLEMFGLRVQSIITPQMEDSSLSRILLLPKIFSLIGQNPLLGNGLGSTISVFSPVLDMVITTPHFDWGYLEIAAETGVIGLIIWLYLLFKLSQKTKKMPRWHLISLVTLIIINITSPALFHVFGVIWITFLFAAADVSAERSPDTYRISGSPLF